MTLLECYKILDIHKSASWLDVKRAYRNLAKQYHPDKNQGNSILESRFKKITHAYQILNGHYRKYKVGPSPQDEIIKLESWIPIKYSEPVSLKFDPFVKPQLFEEWIKRFHDTVYQYERLWFPLDVYQGVTVNDRVAQLGGVIRVRTPRDMFNVKIPAGARHGLKFKIGGKGQKSLFYDKRGDLYLKLRVVPAGIIQPGSMNLFYDMDIRKSDLGTGKVFTLHTIQGPIKFFPLKSIQDGHSLVLKARPDDPSSKKINHILTIHLV